jgi:hypothetical protein
MKNNIDIADTKPVKMSKVNLDALIIRDDFATKGVGERSNTQFSNISVLALETGIILPLLRKPDFQRETSEWDKKNILELLKSLFEDDLIPSVILWQSESNYFVVLDGAHRLSALIAWYLDDYGDREKSNEFYENDISPAQLEMAELTRSYINKNLGSYKQIKKALTDVNPNPSHYAIAKKLGVGIPVQWQNGDSDKAEKSFFKINKQGAPLNPTERKLLEHKKKGNCIAARAIMKRGKGYRYWKQFDDETQTKISELARQIHDALFLPPLTDKNDKIRSMELPVAGKILSAQALPLLFDFLTLTSNLDLKKLKDDLTGSHTVDILQKAKEVVYRINSLNTNSLGLMPAVYLYSSLGKHQPTAVLAVTELIMEFTSLNYWRTFTSIRKDFEEFLIKYKMFFNQVTKKYGSGAKGYKHLKDLLWYIIKKMVDKKNEEQIITALTTDKDFKFLNKNDTETEITTKKFSKAVSSGIWLKVHLPSKVRCEVCGGHIESKSATDEHLKRRREGGLGTVENGGISHPYCNNIYKR